MEILRNVLGEVMKPVLRKVAEGLQSPILLKVVYTSTQFAFIFRAPSTSTLQIYDGDGTLTAVAGNNNSNVTHTTSYATPGTYYFYVEGDYLDLTYILIKDYDNIYGSIDRWGELVNVALLLFRNCINITGNVAVIKDLVSLTNLQLYNTAISGDASELYTLVNLTSLQLQDSDVTFDHVQTFANTGMIFLYDCNWSTAMVDNMVNSFQAVTGGKIVIDGNNAKRSAALDAALLIIAQNNLYITLNETAPIGTLGVELHTDANAASDPNANEANATTGWSQTGLTTGANEFVSQAVIKSTGTYALKANANPNPVANCKCSISFPTVAAHFYRSTIDLRHIGVGGLWYVQIGGVGNQSSKPNNERIEFTETVTYYVATGVSCEFVFIEGSASNDGGLYIDNMSFREVTFV